MITRIWSDLPTFRPVTFVDGMNVVLADTNADSDETESTNGLGKTTLLRIIHFCLGSDLAKDRCLSHPDLNGVKFRLEFAAAGYVCSVERNTATAKQLAVSWDFVADLPVDTERVGDVAQIGVEEWKCALSARLRNRISGGNSFELRKDSVTASRSVPARF